MRGASPEARQPLGEARDVQEIGAEHRARRAAVAHGPVVARGQRRVAQRGLVVAVDLVPRREDVDLRPALAERGEARPVLQRRRALPDRALGVGGLTEGDVRLGGAIVEIDGATRYVKDE